MSHGLRAYWEEAMMEQGIPATLCEAFQATAARNPQEVALRTPGGVVAVTWREYADRSGRSRQAWPRSVLAAGTRSG